MLLLNQTLTSSEKQAAQQAAKKFGDDQFLAYHDQQAEGDPIREPFPTGKQAVPTNNPHWDPDTAMGNWQKKHFLACVLEGLRRTRTKPINYSKLSIISQNLEENPSAFLERLREAFIKHTPIAPDTPCRRNSFKRQIYNPGCPRYLQEITKIGYWS